jgi:hypothetical protein
LQWRRSLRPSSELALRISRIQLSNHLPAAEMRIAHNCSSLSTAQSILRRVLLPTRK